MRRREENGQREYNGERGEHPQTESIDDHCRVFPFSRQLRSRLVRLDLPRDGPQLAENRLEGGVGPARARRRCLHAFVTRPDRRRRRGRPLVGACGSSAAGAVVNRML